MAAEKASRRDQYCIAGIKFRVAAKIGVVAECIVRRLNPRDFIESNHRLDTAIVMAELRRMPWSLLPRDLLGGAS